MYGVGFEAALYGKEENPRITLSAGFAFQPNVFSLL
jgi:hypothetical protein